MSLSSLPISVEKIGVAMNCHWNGAPRFLELAAAIAAVLTLAGCGDLTRSEVARILDGPDHGYACETGLKFNDGGFERAKANGAFAVASG